MIRASTYAAIALVIAAASLHVENIFAASGRQPPPPGAYAGAPDQFTRFTDQELTRGFLALAFGSDLRIGARPKGIRRFNRQIRVHIVPGGSVARAAAVERIVAEYAAKVPTLRLGMDDNPKTANVLIRLIDEKDFESALEIAFGRKTARAFVAKTNPQCMTSVKSRTNGEIIHATSFIIVDQGENVFLDCAYHELLHAFGLSNHDARNPWTTLNQERMVGYLTAYDRALLTILYDRRIRPGMTRVQVQRVLPRVIEALGLATDAGGG